MTAIDEQWELWIPEAYEVSSETVRAYARAVRSPHVGFQSSGVIAADSPIPGTLLAAPMFQVCASIVSTAIPGCNLSQVMQAGQGFTYVRPVHIGDVLSFGARLASHLVKADTDLLTIELMAYAHGMAAVGAKVQLVHSRRDTGVDLAALGIAADRIMMDGTGPSESDAYSEALRGD